MVSMLHSGQQVRVNLAGMQVGSVVFHAAVTDAVGAIVRQGTPGDRSWWLRAGFWVSSSL